MLAKCFMAEYGARNRNEHRHLHFVYVIHIYRNIYIYIYVGDMFEEWRKMERDNEHQVH